MDKLKPCPFCGAVPRLYWDAWEEISETAGTYVLEANHQKGCFIRALNGTNKYCTMTALNEKRLIDAWNRRASDAI